MDLSIVIPAFNEEQAIEEVLRELLEGLKDVSFTFEILVVDDGSTDGTAEKVKALEFVKLHQNLRNGGYGYTLKNGIRAARGEFICITDADGTYPNEDIPNLYELCQKADMVVGEREEGTLPRTPFRSLAKWILSQYVVWVANTHVPDMNSGLRVFRRSVAEKYLSILPNGYSFTITITLALLCNHYRVIYSPIIYRERVGKSKIRPIRDTWNFVQLITRTGMYFAPLRVLSPFILLFLVLFSASVGFDTFFIENLTDKTVILFALFMNTVLFALLADMLQKQREISGP